MNIPCPTPDIFFVIRALVKLIFGDGPDSDSDWEESDSEDDEEKKPRTPAVLEVGMTEADLSNKELGVGGGIIVGAWISHKDNGALVTVTINKCALPVQDIKTKAQLDLSGKRLGVEDAIIIAALIPINVSCTKRFPLICRLLILLLSSHAKRGH